MISRYFLRYRNKRLLPTFPGSGEQGGQATVEYVLMLLLALLMFALVVRTTIGPVFSRFQEGLAGRLNQAFFGAGRAGEALHQLRLSR